MGILFKAKDHIYINEETNERYNSVSKLTSFFKVPFDRDFWSTYVAFKELMGPKKLKEEKKKTGLNGDDLIMHLNQFVDQDELVDTRNNVLKKWEKKNKDSISRGNNYHKQQEKKSYLTKKQENPFTNKPYDVHIPDEIDKEDLTVDEILQFIDSTEKKSINSNLYNLEDGYYPELLIWNDEYKIAGQADKVFITTDKSTGIRYIDIDDYKTNTKIKTSNYFQKMNYPLNHLDDCNWNHYRLQISTYAWMLEQFGFQVRNTAFTHYNKMYKFDYMKSEVENMLRNFKNK